MVGKSPTEKDIMRDKWLGIRTRLETLHELYKGVGEELRTVSVLRELIHEANTQIGKNTTYPSSY